MIRVLNLLGAVGIAFVGVYRLTKGPIVKVNEGVLCIYFLIFALLLVLSELRIRYIGKEFGFLSGPIGKGVFLIFCGTIFLDKVVDVVVVIGIIEIVLGFFNIVLYSWLKTPKVESPDAQDRQQTYQAAETKETKEKKNKSAKSSKPSKDANAKKLSTIRGDGPVIKVDLENGQSRTMSVI